MRLWLSGWSARIVSEAIRRNEAGFDHHLVKPVDPEKLLALFKKVGTPAA